MGQALPVEAQKPWQHSGPVGSSRSSSVALFQAAALEDAQEDGGTYMADWFSSIFPETTINQSSNTKD